MYFLIAAFSVFVRLNSIAANVDDASTWVTLSREFNVPKYATYGSTVEMSCEYRVFPRELEYEVSWHKDGKLLYVYDKDIGKEKFVEYPDIYVDKEKTNNRTLVLQNVTEAATGTYACHLESGDPSRLGDATDRGNLTVLPLNIPVNCNEGSELLWETLKQYYPNVVNSLPYVPDKLNCVNGTAP